jgi:recombinational DNA repair ATPase RecF
MVPIFKVHELRSASTSQVAFYTNRVGKFEKMRRNRQNYKQNPEVTKLTHTMAHLLPPAAHRDYCSCNKKRRTHLAVLLLSIATMADESGELYANAPKQRNVTMADEAKTPKKRNVIPMPKEIASLSGTSAEDRSKFVVALESDPQQRSKTYCVQPRPEALVEGTPAESHPLEEAADGLPGTHAVATTPSR